MVVSTKVRLLIVGSCGRDTGGVAQYIHGQVRHLNDDLDIEIHDTTSPPGKDALSDGGLSKLLWLFSAVLSALWTVLQYPFRSRPDIVHVHASSRLSFYRESVYVVYTALIWKRQVVIHIHGSDFDEFLQECGPVRSWYIQQVLSLCAEVIVLSSYWEDVLQRETNIRHTTVLPNPIDAETFPNGDGTGGPHFIYIANLIERKGVEEFVTAIRQLQKTDGLPFKVSIAGDGPEADRMSVLANEYDSVEYYGYVDEERKRELLTEGSVYVLPTHAEGLPISLLEGMAGGNAIVSTEVGAIPEVIRSENGVLISPVDVDELTEALETLRTNDQLRQTMAQNNSRLVREQYTWSSISEELLALYDRLQSSPNRGQKDDQRKTIPTKPE
jgi:glycosyltransferase involved in cell wall biosynthesis